MDLERNRIDEKGAESLTSTLNQLKNLTSLRLNLFDNVIGDKGVKSISSALNQLKNL